MKQTLRFVRELLRRHWLSFIFASILPAIVGLITVAMTTVAMFTHYSDFLSEDYYQDVIAIYENKHSTPSEGVFHYLKFYYEYFSNTETEIILNECTTLGRTGLIALEVKPISELSLTYKQFTQTYFVIDYEYWQNFPSKIYKGSGFTGTRNEILLDVSNIGSYDIGREYDFTIRDYDCTVLGTVNATVVGFTRSSASLDLSPNNGILCLPYEDGVALGAYKYEYRYIKIPYDLLRELYLINWDEERPVWTMGMIKKYSAPNEEQINEYTMLIFALSALIILSVLTDLCVNGSMLRCTERVAIRSGMRSKDIAIGYGIKAFLQLMMSTVIMLVVLLCTIHKFYTLLVVEYMWGGVIAMFLLGLISWALYSVGLFAAQRRKNKIKKG